MSATQPSAKPPRAAARLRLQRFRDRKRETARLTAKAHADALEDANDEFSPAIMRHAVMSSNGGILLGPRVEIIMGRPSRVDPLDLCRSREITDEHRRAARQLRLDWNDVGAGIGVGAVDYLRSGGGGSGEGGHRAMMEQIAARARLDGAMSYLGALAPAVARVILDSVPISIWASEPDPFGTKDPDPERNKRTMAEGIAWMALALTRLAAFYLPPVEAMGGRIRMFGPARSAYSMDRQMDA